jgi:hypothetical protein
LDSVAWVFVLGLHVGAGVQGLVGFEVFGGMAGIVPGHHVLHEYPGVTRILLPLIRQRVARIKRLEQLVLQNPHEAVS